MEGLARWFAAGGGSTVAYVAALLALVVMALAPKPIKARLRAALVLAAAAALCDIALRFWPGSSAAGMLRATQLSASALSATRLAFVIVVDLLIERGGRSPMNQLLRDVLQAAAYIVGLVIALRAANISFTSMITTGTVVTAIVGLALQNTLGNLAAGISLQIERPFKLGDWLRLDKSDVLGRVVSTNWRTITIQSDDRALFVIPNGVFTATPFFNFSEPGGGARRNLYFTIPYDYSPAQVHAALLAACADTAEVLEAPPPSVLTWTYGDSGVTYWLRFFVADFARRDPVQGEVGSRVWYHLHRRKIPVAVPTRKTFMHKLDQKALDAQTAEALRDRRDAIDAVDFLKPLPDEAKEIIVQRGHRRLFGPRETIISQGDTGREFFIVRSGTVAVLSEGHEVARLGPGAFFGELALLTGKERHASVIAVEETEVFEIDENIFKDVLHKDPALANTIAEVVATRQAELEARRGGGGRATMTDVHGWKSDILSKITNLFGL